MKTRGGSCSRSCGGSSFGGVQKARRAAAAHAASWLLAACSHARFFSILALVCPRKRSNFGYHLACARPSMTAVATAVSAVLAEAHRDLHNRAGPFPPLRSEVIDCVQQAVSAQQRRLADRAAALRRQARQLLRDGATVMTLSRSSTVGAGGGAARGPAMGPGLQQHKAGGPHPILCPTLVPCTPGGARGGRGGSGRRAAQGHCGRVAAAV